MRTLIFYIALLSGLYFAICIFSLGNVGNEDSAKISLVVFTITMLIYGIIRKKESL